jgi:myo-inositol 2-dehydrogenase/D-chiro-inositol 1-dehydrogenase
MGGLGSGRRIRVALAGLGRMGRIHADNLAFRCTAARLAGVYDADAERTDDVAFRLDVPAVRSFDDLLADDAVDAVAIATPTATHAELVTRAALAGKHVFCEKPISLDRDAAAAAVHQAARSGVVFQVGFHRRFDPDWVAAVQRIRAGELGEVLLFRSSLRDKLSPDPQFLTGSGGLFRDVMIHDLDTARWMVGEVAEITATGAAPAGSGFAEIGDVHTAAAMLRFTDGALGLIDNCRSAGYGYECSTEVVGSAATVRIDQPARRNYEWRTPGQASVPLVADFEERFPFAYVAELDAFAVAIGTGSQPEADGADALVAFDLACAADESWRTGRTVRVGKESA